MRQKATPLPQVLGEPRQKACHLHGVVWSHPLAEQISLHLYPLVPRQVYPFVQSVLFLQLTDELRVLLDPLCQDL